MPRAVCAGSAPAALGILPLYVISSLMNLLMDARLHPLLRLAGFAVLAATLWVYFSKKDSPIVLGCFFVLGLLLYCGWAWIEDIYELLIRMLSAA